MTGREPFPPRLSLTICDLSGCIVGIMSDSIARLYEAVEAAGQCDPATSRTARLIRAGIPKAAKKMAEEAVEVVIDAMAGESEAVVKESADLIYNLVVLWSVSGVRPEHVWAEMERRERMMGIAEKLPKKDASAAAARRKVVALAAHGYGKRPR